MEGRFLHFLARYQRYPVKSAFTDTIFYFYCRLRKWRNPRTHDIVPPEKKEKNRPLWLKFSLVVHCIRCFVRYPVEEKIVITNTTVVC